MYIIAVPSATVASKLEGRASRRKNNRKAPGHVTCGIVAAANDLQKGGATAIQGTCGCESFARFRFAFREVPDVRLQL